MAEVWRHRVFTETPVAPIGMIRRVRLDADTLLLAQRVRRSLSVIVEIKEDEWYMIYAHYAGLTNSDGQPRWYTSGNTGLFELHFPDDYMEWIL